MSAERFTSTQSLVLLKESETELEPFDDSCQTDSTDNNSKVDSTADHNGGDTGKI